MALVKLVQSDDSYACSTAETLLAGMLRLGRSDIPVGCTNGGCGICKVRVLEGEVRLVGPVSRAHVSETEEACGFTLACRAAPKCDVMLEIVGKLGKRVLKNPPEDSV